MQAGDIAILVSTHSEAAEIQSALQHRGIVAVRSKTGNIWEAQEAADFLCFLMACLNPTERLVNQLMLSPLYGKNDADLRAIADAELREIYESFTVQGKQWRDGASVSIIWMQFIEARSLRERLLQVVGGERQLTNYLHIAESAQRLERIERLSPERLIDRVLEMIRTGADPSSTEEHLVRLESDGQAVKIMTMHGSKGLEFPIVFLPSLWQLGIRTAARNEQLLQTPMGDPDCYLGLEADPESVVAAASAENLRLGYVAMTRAVHWSVYYNVREMPLPSRGNHANGWFDQWLYEQRAYSYPSPSHASFLTEVSALDPVEYPDAREDRRLHTRRLGRTLAADYQITSYTALSRSEKAGKGSPDPSTKTAADDDVNTGDAATARGATDSMVADLLLRDFPAGALTGTCVHEILERCDFTRKAQWAHLINQVINKHFPAGGDALRDARCEQILALLEVLVAHVRLGSAGRAVDLATLAPQACMTEMEFYFPIQQVDLQRLEQVLVNWGQRVGLEYAATAYPAKTLQGFLTGSVDLFFMQGGRYTLLDWKTNRPLKQHRPLRSDYNRAGMHQHMVHGRYYLQALIYSVATSIYLRQRLGQRFDWETHIGGFIYCFVRGLGEGTGWLHEAFSEAEVREAAEALGQSAQQKGLA